MSRMGGVALYTLKAYPEGTPALFTLPMATANTQHMQLVKFPY